MWLLRWYGPAAIFALTGSEGGACTKLKKMGGGLEDAQEREGDCLKTGTVRKMRMKLMQMWRVQCRECSSVKNPAAIRNQPKEWSAVDGMVKCSPQCR